MAHTYTLVVTPSAVSRTMMSSGVRVQYLPGQPQAIALDQRVISTFQVDLAPLQRSEVESLQAFHAIHQGGRIFQWNGGPFGVMENFNLVGQGDGGTTLFYLMNRNVGAGSSSVQLVRASSTSVISTAPAYTLGAGAGTISFSTAPNSDWDIEAKFASTFRVLFEPDGLEISEVARRVYRATLALRETIY